MGISKQPKLQHVAPVLYPPPSPPEMGDSILLPDQGVAGKKAMRNISPWDSPRTVKPNLSNLIPTSRLTANSLECNHQRIAHTQPPHLRVGSKASVCLSVCLSLSPHIVPDREQLRKQPPADCSHPTHSSESQAKSLCLSVCYSEQQNASAGFLADREARSRRPEQAERMRRLSI